ncbi:hypothetical protein LTR48_006331 [Friedmanniomyces endolithicus]|uniref:Fungal-type protein kinase domain-containing protein n=1 Tax=Rachicladosporium monterosium TaxID=1507873 RepID=A0ABR0L1J7_9PEZI|nr:hypothetical protein LTR48_006331 [Friedmanniomyces endolithicus]KAK5142077.1 hypothetical protein LTR32_005506 [Rachicladosporium monterosium]
MAASKLEAASDEDREGDDEDLRPKKIQKKPKRKKHDGAADAKDDPTGPCAAEKHTKELPGLEAALEKEKAVEPDPGVPFRLFGIFFVNVQFSRAGAKGVCGYLNLRNKNEILALDELPAHDLQDFWTIIDNKYGYTSKNAKDQELGGTNRRLDIGKFMGTCRNLKITLEDIASDEMPDAARIPPEKHTNMGRMCLSWLRMVLPPGQTTRTLPEAFTGTQREEYNEEPFPGVPWLGEDIHRALCYIQVAKGKNTKSKNAAGTGERSGYGGSVYSRPPTTRTHSRSASICHRITHVDFHLGILPITRLSRRRHSRELHTPYHVT